MSLDGLIADGGRPGARRPPRRSSRPVEAAPLSESADFVDVFDHLDDGLLTMYVDGEGIAAAGEQLVDSLGLDVRRRWTTH